jgi:hypothetical protein
MSAIQTLNNIEIGNKNGAQNQSDLAPIYIPIGVLLILGIAIASMGVTQNKTIELPIRLYMLQNQLFTLPILLFFITLDYTGWYLFQADLLKTLLTLPVESNEIYNRLRICRRAPIKRNPFMLLFTFFIPLNVGLFYHSFIYGVATLIFIIPLMGIIDSLAIIAIIKNHRIYLPIRSVVLLAVSIIFCASVILMFKSSPLSTDIQIFLKKLVSYNLVPYETSWQIIVAASLPLYILKNLIHKAEKRVWNSTIDRKMLISTAFPLTNQKSKKRRKTVFETDMRNSQILKRVIFLLTDTLGTVHVGRVVIAMVATLTVPFILIFLDMNIISTLTVIVTPVVSCACFTAICFFRRNPAPFAKYALPVGLLESSLSMAALFVPIIIVTGIETICIIKGFENPASAQMHRSTALIFRDLFTFAILATLFFGTSPVVIRVFIPGKKILTTLVAIFTSLLLIILMFSLIVGEIYANANSIFSVICPGMILPQEDILATGFRLVLTGFVNILDGETVNFGMFSPDTSSAPFFLPAWSCLTALFLFSWYYAVKYGREIPKTSANSIFLNQKR